MKVDGFEAAKKKRETTCFADKAQRELIATHTAGHADVTNVDVFLFRN